MRVSAQDLMTARVPMHRHNEDGVSPARPLLVTETGADLSAINEEANEADNPYVKLLADVIGLQMPQSGRKTKRIRQ